MRKEGYTCVTICDMEGNILAEGKKERVGKKAREMGLLGRKARYLIQGKTLYLFLEG